MNANAIAIGIDLGTTNSCVGIFRDGKVNVIPNELGQKTTPSYVSFTETGRLIGDAAMNQVAKNPQNTIFDVKRIIGRAFDTNLENELKTYSFRVTNKAGKPYLLVTYKGEEKLFAPEAISAMLLSKLKSAAEKYLATSIRDAVITVPAYFNDAQRQATKDAGTIAGLNVLRIINEPTAAALAYGLDNNIKEERNLLIFDLGGGTFDVSVLTISGESLFEVRATAGDTHLGGTDFNNRMVDYFIDDFKQKYELDLRTNPRSLRRLRTAVERAKHLLSASNEAPIEIDALYENQDYYTTISRARFENLCMDLFERTIKLVEKALLDAKLDRTQINEILLVGGSTRIPKVQDLLQDFFYGKSLNLTINPDEAVACGAAIQAAILIDQTNSNTKDILLIDVTPLSLGIETIGGVMSTIIKRNTRVPCKYTKIFTTTQDNQSQVTIQVYEGERVMTQGNNLLSTFVLDNIPPAPRCVPQISVMFDIDSNGILKVTAKDRNTGRAIKIEINSGRLSEAEIKRMISDAEKYAAEDEKTLENINARNEMESLIYSTKKKLKEYPQTVSKDFALKKCEDALIWLGANPSAEKDEYNLKMLEIVNISSSPSLTMQSDTSSSSSDTDDSGLTNTN